MLRLETFEKLASLDGTPNSYRLGAILSGGRFVSLSDWSISSWDLDTYEKQSFFRISSRDVKELYSRGESVVCVDKSGTVTVSEPYSSTPVAPNSSVAAAACWGNVVVLSSFSNRGATLHVVNLRTRERKQVYQSDKMIKSLHFVHGRIVCATVNELLLLTPEVDSKRSS